MHIIDTTTYFEEDLMMDLRFNILDKFVDKFIICEARFTHSGKEKEIKFKKKKFPKFEEKINHIIIDKEPDGLIKKKNLNNQELRQNSILRIKEQRNFLGHYLQDYSSEDYILHSDNDEIPNLNHFDFRKNKKKIIIFNQLLFYYKFNLILPNVNWYGTKACKIKHLHNIDLLRSIKNKKYPLYRLDILFSKIKFNSIEVVNKGGWHFSNLKNAEALEKKYLNDENHSEYELRNYSINRIRENLINKTIDYNHKAKKNSSNRFMPTKLEKTDLKILPLYLRDNYEKYSNWFD